MRLLVISKDFPAPGQPEDGIAVLRQARALQRLGHEILVVRVVPYAPPVTHKWRRYAALPARYAIEGIPVRIVRAFFPPRMLAMEHLPLQVDRAIRRIVDEFRPDVIHAHCLIPSGQLAVRFGVPSVITAHGSDAYDWPWRRPGLQRAAAEGVARATAVVAVSDFIGGYVRKLAQRDVSVVFNGADDAVFKPADSGHARAALGLPTDRFVIVLAGGPPQIKGAFDLVDAVARLHDIAPILVYAGPEPTDPALVRAAADARIDARFVGMLDHPALAALLAASDVFCLPSYREGLPLVLCEAMLCARPIVATPVGGIPEILIDGERGYLVPPGNPAALAERLRRVANDARTAQRTALAAYEFARSHLTWEANAKRYSRLYAELVATPSDGKAFAPALSY
ncbi:MAG TPA: glycosyltransferase [Candidatus Baltobacteraceae bacterium]|nr:glycosyltransferase [Candidatus Baltobacteraceae bacterium]